MNAGDRIHDCLIDGPATKQELVDELGLHPMTVCFYIAKLKKLGEVHVESKLPRPDTGYKRGRKQHLIALTRTKKVI